MKKLFIALLFLAAPVAQAQVFDAISGHAKDIAARFAEQKTISGQVLKSGKIDESAKGQDAVHNSRGSFTIVRSGKDLYLQTSADFYASLGPDYHLYISKNRAIKDNDEFKGSGQIEVSRLVKPNGAYYYLLPTQNIDDVASVLIWCKQFGEYIGSADLK